MQCIRFCLFSLLPLERQKVSHSLVSVLSQCAFEVGEARSFFPSLCQEQALTLSPGRPEHSHHVASAMRRKRLYIHKPRRGLDFVETFPIAPDLYLQSDYLKSRPFSIRVYFKLSLNVLEATQTMKSMSGVSESLLIVAEL